MHQLVTRVKRAVSIGETAIRVFYLHTGAVDNASFEYMKDSVQEDHHIHNGEMDWATLENRQIETLVNETRLAVRTVKDLHKGSPFPTVCSFMADNPLELKPHGYAQGFAD